jgi:uroporphyrinogen-III decarboxylase
MAAKVFLDLAAQGHRVPIGTDLVLQEEPDPEALKHDAGRLGRVVERAARAYRTPLALPLMDLTLEKADLVGFFGVREAELDSFHFHESPSDRDIAQFREASNRPFRPRNTANIEAVRYIADRTDLFPIGMLIGPFSLMTKLVADPISPVAMAGSGTTAGEDSGVRLVERCLDMALATVLRSAAAQIEAGARAIIVCEPAANRVYLSPRQMRAGSDIFERFALAPNRQLRALLARHDVHLVFHNCGELTEDMVRQFASELQPAMLSLGSSRKLWEDAAVVPPSVVLFGNLPTKRFYSDADLPVDEVRRLTGELVRNMRQCGHPHILGSECDVLHVPDAAAAIRAKVDAMLTAPALA